MRSGDVVGQRTAVVCINHPQARSSLKHQAWPLRSVLRFMPPATFFHVIPANLTAVGLATKMRQLSFQSTHGSIKQQSGQQQEIHSDHHYYHNSLAAAVMKYLIGMCVRAI